MNKKQVIYYTDELHDEFSSFTTTPPVIGDDYDYERSSFGKKLGRFFVYRIFTYPVAYLYSKFAFGRKIVGKNLLRPYRRQARRITRSASCSIEPESLRSARTGPLSFPASLLT